MVLRTSEQENIRLQKREKIIASGTVAYPVKVPRTTTLQRLKIKYANLAPEVKTGETVGIVGRIIFLRNTGKLCFATLQEGDGTQLQLMISLAEVGAEGLADWKNLVDIGDFVFASGEVVASKRGELSVMVARWEMASKAIKPLPVAYKDLNEETRVRNRHVELIMNDTARKNARIRIATMRSLRNALEARGFLEVETPMLQTLQGGAAAKPFVTHSNALDMDLFLRIAPELFLKRCVIGGFERVFEINRNFRNEGVDSSHSPEFSMLETYQAYATYDDSALMIREIIQEIAQSVCGTLQVKLVDGTDYDFAGEWEVIEMYPSLSAKLGEEVTPLTPVTTLKNLASRIGLELNSSKSNNVAGKIVEELWEFLIGDKLVKPTFVKNFPAETSPLTREHRSIPGVSEKWDLYIRSFELATGYSELIDPVVQREKFMQQAKLAAAGDEEAMVLDEEFLAAMEQGMPPTTGTGMGIDRLLMALTGLGIRDTILFPLVKPKV